MENSTPAQERVLEILEEDRDELVQLCLDLGNTPSPHAQEREVATKVVDWFRRHGIQAYLQPITERSANAVGFLPGTGGGKSLICDAHIDTGSPLADDAPERVKRIHQAWVEGDLIYGYGVINCKAQVAAFMAAARAIQKAGVRLQGDLYVAGVAFETGDPSVGARQGIDYPGSGFGTKWLVDRGVIADYALVGETSDFGIITAECGKLRLEIRVPGRRVYIPRLRRGRDLSEHPNALVKTTRVISALEEWSVEYEQRKQFEFPGGVIIPKAQVVQVTRAQGDAFLHMEIFLVPGENPLQIKREIVDVIRETGIPCEVTPYDWARGHVARNAEPLIDALESAHVAVHGRPSLPPPPEVISMWRDINVFNEVGIPSVCYGPPRQEESFSDEGDRCMRIDDLVANSKVYALTALKICGVATGAVAR